MASDAQLQRAVKEFGSRLAQATKHNWIAHLKVSDVDEIADALIQRASNQFLDRAMARRLETISGQELVNALARSERLGYDVRDIVAGEPAQRGEQVIPSMHGAHMVSTPHTTPAMPPPPPTASQQAPAPYQAPPTPQQPPPRPIISWTSCLPANFTAPPGGLNLFNEIKPCQRCGRPCSSEEALKQVSQLMPTNRDSSLIFSIASEEGSLHSLSSFLPKNRTGCMCPLWLCLHQPRRSGLSYQERRVR